MAQHWRILSDLQPRKLLLRRYEWSKLGLLLYFYDSLGRRMIKLTFQVDLDGFRIVFLRNDLEAEDRLYSLMQDARLPDEPFCPAFIETESSFIDYVKTMAGYDAKDVVYYQYTIVTEDFWIEVVSDTSPKIEVNEQGND